MSDTILNRNKDHFNVKGKGGDDKINVTKKKTFKKRATKSKKTEILLTINKVVKLYFNKNSIDSI